VKVFQEYEKNWTKRYKMERYEEVRLKVIIEQLQILKNIESKNYENYKRCLRELEEIYYGEV
jgi:hypothetical protein